MLFNSLSFLIFFIVVTSLYFILPHKYRWFLLLVSSCIFYMTLIPVYILILFLLITIDYFAAIYIEKSIGKKRLFALWFSILSVCITLLIFKYFNFFAGNFNTLAEIIHWNYPISYLSLLLPIGLSFHTFQSLAYVIEVYNGRFKAERNYGIYALYVMFYPQLVAGPIERPQNLIHQFYEKHSFEYKRVTDGLKLMLWGLFKKVVIADRLATVVNVFYGDPTAYSGLPLIMATVFFAFQIYCDFSGYSDMAIGAAQVMGFKLMTNFKRPYFSRSISEFWRRWHISLSTWFKDYLYIPLGGNRVKVSRIYFNLFIVFLVSGLWHGANWTFVVWGALHGIYIIVEKMWLPIWNKINKIIYSPRLIHIFEVLFTFTLVCIGWIFFRANNISDAFYIITHLFSNFSISSLQVYSLIDRYIVLYCVLLIIVMEIVHFIQERQSVRNLLDSLPVFWRWSLYIIVIIFITFFGVFTNTKFIYFQF